MSPGFKNFSCSSIFVSGLSSSSVGSVMSRGFSIKSPFKYGLSSGGGRKSEFESSLLFDGKMKEGLLFSTCAKVSCKAKTNPNQM